MKAVNSISESFLLAILILCPIFIMFEPGQAARITVEPGESIQSAIDEASSGDTIEVNSGTYGEGIDMNKQLTLRGIDAGNGAPIISSATINADSCELVGFRVENPGGFGIAVLSNDNKIADNEVRACAGGIFLRDCQGNTISHNDARVTCQGLMVFLKGDGIHLLRANNNVIRNNVAEDGFIGIYMDASSRNLVEDNQVSNNINGIGLLTSSGNSIKNNTLKDNSDDGLGILKFSNGSVIEGNTIENNGDCGIYLQDSSQNVIFLNSLAGNKENADSKDVRSKGSYNQWHSTEPMSYSSEGQNINSYLGNYWSDYGGGDSDRNGIGDDPHKFIGGQDDYPLVKR